MKRIRNLGLAAVIALVATAAIAVPSASASWLVSNSSPTTLLATPTGSHFFTFNGVAVACNEGLRMLGTQKGLASETVAMPEAENGGCAVLTTGSLKWNGCGLTFHLGTQVSEGTYSGTADLGPTTCGPITIEDKWCSFKIQPKTGLKATYVNMENGNVKISLEATKLQYSSSGCGAGSGEKATWNGSWEVDAENSGETPIPIHVAEVPTGFYTSGGNFTAEHMPANVKGSVTSKNVFTTSKYSVTCTAGQFLGGTPGSPDLSGVAVSYNPCTDPYGDSIVVSMNSCTYGFHLGGGSSLSLDCSKAGDAVEFNVYSFGAWLCKVSFPAQSLGAASYEVVGSGSERKVVATATGSGLKYSRTGNGLCGPESGTNGTLGGKITLEAVSYE